MIYKLFLKYLHQNTMLFYILVLNCSGSNYRYLKNNVKFQMLRYMELDLHSMYLIAFVDIL